MKQVKAKFECTGVLNMVQNSEVKMTPVVDYSGENADFTKYTPWGEVKLGISNDAPASGFFEPGKKYYATFEEAPEN